MIKHLQVSLQILPKLLMLDESVQVVAVRQTDSNNLDVTLVDPNKTIPEECRLEIVKPAEGKWVEAPAKGETRGAEASPPTEDHGKKKGKK